MLDLASLKVASIKVLIEKIQEAADLQRRSALEAHAGATHAESKAENKYDTRGLEASYLAAGQSRRVLELEKQLHQLQALLEESPRIDDQIRSGSLVHLITEDKNKFFLLLPFAGGYQLDSDVGVVITVSTDSPLGKVLLQKEVNEVFTFQGKSFEIMGSK